MKKPGENIRISLRALEPSDIDLLFTWENDPEVWQVSHTQTPYSRFILQKYLDNSHQDIYQTRQLRLMIDLHETPGSSRTVGAIDLFDFDPQHLRAGVGILVYGKEDRNKGVAGQALKELIEYTFNKLHLHQLYCNIAANNKVSLRLFKSAGFELVGTKRDWLRATSGYSDELLFQLINPFQA